MRLAAAASEIDQLSRHLDYETATSANTARGLQRLRQHMLALLPLLASIEDRRIALNLHEGTSANIAAISATAARWLAGGCQDGPEADGLRAVKDVVIATKFGHDLGTGSSRGSDGLDSRPERIRAVAEASLKRLRVESIDLFSISTASIPISRSRTSPAR